MNVDSIQTSRLARLQARIDRVYASLRRLVDCPPSTQPKTYPVYSTPAPDEFFHALRRFHEEHPNWRTDLKKVPWWARLCGDEAHWRLHFVRPGAAATENGRRRFYLW